MINLYTIKLCVKGSPRFTVASHSQSEAYHDWSGEAADAQLYAKLLLSQNFCKRPLMRFISLASNIGPAAVVSAA